MRTHEKLNNPGFYKVTEQRNPLLGWLDIINPTFTIKRPFLCFMILKVLDS